MIIGHMEVILYNRYYDTHKIRSNCAAYLTIPVEGWYTVIPKGSNTGFRMYFKAGDELQTPDLLVNRYITEDGQVVF